MKYLAIALLGCTMGAMAQTAKVIQLTPEEAKQAKALYDEQRDLTKRQAAFDEAIKKKYLTEPFPIDCKPQNYGGCGSNIKEGWWPGKFVFSDDFKFIVPAPATPPAPQALPWSNCAMGTICLPGGANILPASAEGSR